MPAESLYNTKKTRLSGLKKVIFSTPTGIFLGFIFLCMGYFILPGIMPATSIGAIVGFGIGCGTMLGILGSGVAMYCRNHPKLITGLLVVASIGSFALAGLLIASGWGAPFGGILIASITMQLVSAISFIGAAFKTQAFLKSVREMDDGALRSRNKPQERSVIQPSYSEIIDKLLNSKSVPRVEQYKSQLSADTFSDSEIEEGLEHLIYFGVKNSLDHSYVANQIFRSLSPKYHQVAITKLEHELKESKTPLSEAKKTQVESAILAVREMKPQ